MLNIARIEATPKTIHVSEKKGDLGEQTYHSKLSLNRLILTLVVFPTVSNETNKNALLSTKGTTELAIIHHQYQQERKRKSLINIIQYT